jgi:hypothetical protein
MRLQLVMAAGALILSAGIANAGPCNTGQTTGTGQGQQAGNRAAQADQRQEHAQPKVAEQPSSAGETSTTARQAPEPSAKMTDQDRFSGTGTHSENSQASAKMADQGC